MSASIWLSSMYKEITIRCSETLARGLPHASEGLAAVALDLRVVKGAD
jgi:hypothetical protein